LGIEVQSVRFLVLAARLGVDFSDTLTIGRQRIMLNEREAADALRGAVAVPTSEDIAAIAGRTGVFSDRLFHMLGANRVQALDFSDYEGATIIHDLNEPLPRQLINSHSAVFDGGTLEHVFNFPVALANLMRLPRPGGHLMLAVPANNEMGHGFYQFSPEAFFRTLNRANGFEIEGLFLAPFFRLSPWLMMRDPKVSGRRVGYSGWRAPTYILVIARKLADAIPFFDTPQQSDYVENWEAARERTDAHGDAASLWDVRRLAHAAAPLWLVHKARSARALFSRPDSRSAVQFDPSADGIAAVRRFYGSELMPLLA
jgi:hypothetical protein